PYTTGSAPVPPRVGKPLRRCFNCPLYRNCRGVFNVAEVGPSIFARHEFLIRRLHSLTGLMFGGYMVVHLATNASVLGGAAMFQKNVLAIHGLGPILPLLEWGLIFLPILFHAIVGLFLLFEMIPNNRAYP